ncbi:MAG: globin domain-containing protein [Verrucomicrobiales bacterium]
MLPADWLKADLKQLAPRSEVFVETFYERLFSHAPDLRQKLAGAEMVERGLLMFHALGLVLSRIDEIDDLEPVLKGLGKRHLRYGVRREHHPILLEGILATLRELIGENFSREREREWKRALQTVSNRMISGLDPGSTIDHSAAAKANLAAQADRTGNRVSALD